VGELSRNAVKCGQQEKGRKISRTDQVGTLRGLMESEEGSVSEEQRQQEIT
jgi:hypothetical protein